MTYACRLTCTDRFPNVPTKLLKKKIIGGGGGFPPPPPPPSGYASAKTPGPGSCQFFFYALTIVLWGASFLSLLIEYKKHSRLKFKGPPWGACYVRAL